MSVDSEMIKDLGCTLQGCPQGEAGHPFRTKLDTPCGAWGAGRQAGKRVPV
jgi:hypothetical protein